MSRNERSRCSERQNGSCGRGKSDFYLPRSVWGLSVNSDKTWWEPTGVAHHSPHVDGHRERKLLKTSAVMHGLLQLTVDGAPILFSILLAI